MKILESYFLEPNDRVYFNVQGLGDLGDGQVWTVRAANDPLTEQGHQRVLITQGGYDRSVIVEFVVTPRFHAIIATRRLHGRFTLNPDKKPIVPTCNECGEAWPCSTFRGTEPYMVRFARHVEDIYEVREIP